MKQPAPRLACLLAVCLSAPGALGARVKSAKLARASEEASARAKLTPSADTQMVDLYVFWSTFRDPDNGLYCDAIYLDGTTVCGPANDFYSLASVGMGLVAECVFAELGLQTKPAAEARVLQTISSVKSNWPRENGKGFFQHFTTRAFQPMAEYSTIDTAIGALGALFAGKFFQGQVKTNALELVRLTKWTAGIKGTEPPAATAQGTVPSACARHIAWGHSAGKNEAWYQTAFAKKMYLISGVDLSQGTYEDFQRMYKCLNLNAYDCNDLGLDFPTTCSEPPCDACLESIMYLTASESGEMQDGILKPFNEYYLLAYLATKAELQHPNATNTSLALAARYFEVFFGTNSSPPGDGEFPKLNQYHGFEVLSDSDGFIPSFHVQFNYFLTAAFGQSTYYLEKFKAAMGADMKYWELAIPSSDSLHGKVWGLGAGIAPGPKYEANSISNNANLTFSAPIMAGFLNADPASTATILGQLRHMYANNTCRYKKDLADGSSPQFLWRCSITWPDYRAHRVESIDFSTMVLGFAQQYLPSDFYQTFGY
ncbi:unnamed protein product [Prorocentrum cordatum]|uniref:Glycoamylase-like domain-containing protein n=1 Tax=Prorocentrum cordatum TaxID=2364126 RepID=A0ABN9S3V1_9DINO|nr:unnamed protein product [Polarella glacialis]